MMWPLKCHDRRYFDPETVGLDFEGMCSDIESAPEGSIIVLHGKLTVFPAVSEY